MSELRKQIEKIFDSEINFCYTHHASPSRSSLYSLRKKVLGLLADTEKTHVTVLREKLRERLDSLMESLEPLTIGERKLIRDFKKGLLGEGETTVNCFSNCASCISYGHFDCEPEPDKNGQCLNFRLDESGGKK